MRDCFNELNANLRGNHSAGEKETEFLISQTAIMWSRRPSDDTTIIISGKTRFLSHGLNSYLARRNASTSLTVGSEGCAPTRVTEMAAAALAKLAA